MNAGQLAWHDLPLKMSLLKVLLIGAFNLAQLRNDRLACNWSVEDYGDLHVIIFGFAGYDMIDYGMGITNI